MQIKSAAIENARLFDDTRKAIAESEMISRNAVREAWARLPDDLLARVANRIVNEVDGINRVVYDITSKPPATIEWE